MTRLWAINPQHLCRQHLLAEHAELHQEVGTLRNHPHGHAIVNGHAAKGQVDTSLIKPRHDELAAELLRRGYTHDSPLMYHDELDLGSVDAAGNRVELGERCGECRERMEAVTP